MVEYDARPEDDMLDAELRWAKSLARVIAESLAIELSQRFESQQRSLAVISPVKTQNLVLVDSAFLALRFESRDWRSLV